MQPRESGLAKPVDGLRAKFRSRYVMWITVQRSDQADLKLDPVAAPAAAPGDGGLLPVSPPGAFALCMLPQRHLMKA
ncbi:hypothetical protein BJF93_06920 [Xaviernesmea oryzae]|uniref:Uncharacterized protein n=1 Tax=Xaviernesmea oryzae TaxID=464029 RepID=A0A1Q9ASH3_9HYPH|nr:hypothetical protein BJF93_06920 [Xaviernesmea oryzae]